MRQIHLKPVICADGHVRALVARVNLEGSILGRLNYLIKAINTTYKKKLSIHSFTGLKNVHLLPEQLATLFPGQLIVERAGGLVLIGLIWRRRGQNKSTKSAALA